mmetsp:Transcript_52926/g.95167  ORF Transcript_52926/g.95167 Transcript_52926/m.95167 type:complete len:335 (-) Transcript_52926:259-1263(-)
MSGRQWKVVGGADKGGILVREGKATTSNQHSDRLETGALIEEKELEGDRLHYEKLSGKGPASGWISIKLKDKELAVPVESSKKLEERVKIPFIYNYEKNIVGCVAGSQPGAEKAPIAVVLIPGNPGIQFGASHAGAPLLLEIEKALSQKGITNLRFDYVGVGMSAPGGETVDPKAWKAPTDKEAAQSAMSAAKWAKEHLSDNIIVCGYSMGSSHALEVVIKGVAFAYVSLSIGYDVWKFFPDKKAQDDLKMSMEGQSTLSCKVLYVVGDKDRMTPMAQVTRLIEARKDGGAGCTLEVIKGGVHDLKDKETEVAEIVTDWVSGLDAGVGSEAMGA